MAVEAKVQGLPDLRAALQSIAPKLRVRALRNALSAGARVVRDAARSVTPVMSNEEAAVRAPVRKPKTVRNAISVRTSRRDRRGGNVGVFVNVRPAKRGQRGAKSPNDPFYWQWLEFGWTPATGKRGGQARNERQRERRRQGASYVPSIPGAGFLRFGATKLSQALQVFVQKIGPAIEKLNNKGQTP
jgi:HK97 gp10 family phage protein